MGRNFNYVGFEYGVGAGSPRPSVNSEDIVSDIPIGSDFPALPRAGTALNVLSPLAEESNSTTMKNTLKYSRMVSEDSAAKAPRKESELVELYDAVAAEEEKKE